MPTNGEISLTELQINMLTAGQFNVDGGNSRRGIESADQLHEYKYVTCFDSGSDEEQYTCYNYSITKKGKEALKSHT